jgi:hypothetical protein
MVGCGSVQTNNLKVGECVRAQHVGYNGTQSGVGNGTKCSGSDEAPRFTGIVDQQPEILGYCLMVWVTDAVIALLDHPFAFMAISVILMVLVDKVFLMTLAMVFINFSLSAREVARSNRELMTSQDYVQFMAELDRVRETENKNMSRRDLLRSIRIGHVARLRSNYSVTNLEDYIVELHQSGAPIEELERPEGCYLELLWDAAIATWSEPDPHVFETKLKDKYDTSVHSKLADEDVVRKEMYEALIIGIRESEETNKRARLAGLARESETLIQDARLKTKFGSKASKRNKIANGTIEGIVAIDDRDVRVTDTVGSNEPFTCQDTGEENWTWADICDSSEEGVTIEPSFGGSTQFDQPSSHDTWINIGKGGKRARRKRNRSRKRGGRGKQSHTRTDTHHTNESMVEVAVDTSTSVNSSRPTTAKADERAESINYYNMLGCARQLESTSNTIEDNVCEMVETPQVTSVSDDTKSRSATSDHAVDGSDGGTSNSAQQSDSDNYTKESRSYAAVVSLASDNKKMGASDLIEMGVKKPGTMYSGSLKTNLTAAMNRRASQKRTNAIGQMTGKLEKMEQESSATVPVTTSHVISRSEFVDNDPSNKQNSKKGIWSGHEFSWVEMRAEGKYYRTTAKIDTLEQLKWLWNSYKPVWGELPGHLKGAVKEDLLSKLNSQATEGRGVSELQYQAFALGTGTFVGSVKTKLRNSAPTYANYYSYLMFGTDSTGRSQLFLKSSDKRWEIYEHIQESTNLMRGAKHPNNRESISLERLLDNNNGYCATIEESAPEYDEQEVGSCHSTGASDECDVADQGDDTAPKIQTQFKSYEISDELLDQIKRNAIAADYCYLCLFDKMSDKLTAAKEFGPGPPAKMLCQFVDTCSDETYIVKESESKIFFCATESDGQTDAMDLQLLLVGSDKHIGE